jgi:NAD binding domain of 6-phosphogluconate dehydrogenase
VLPLGLRSRSTCAVLPRRCGTRYHVVETRKAVGTTLSSSILLRRASCRTFASRVAVCCAPQLRGTILVRGSRHHILLVSPPLPCREVRTVGVKRGSCYIDHAPAAKVAWEQLLDPCHVDILEAIHLPRVCVCGMSDLGQQLAQCFTSKAGSVSLGVHDPEGSAQKLSLLPGVTSHANVAEAASWADLVIFCGSYEEGHSFLSTASMHRRLHGKCVLQLSNGTPQEAASTAAFVKRLGGKYLDACLLSEARSQIFGCKGTSLMVCGDKAAWSQYRDVITAAAPSAFYGGKVAEHANAVGVAICTFMTAVYMVRSSLSTPCLLSTDCILVCCISVSKLLSNVR